MSDTVKGSCLCQQVQFTIELPSKGVAHCHCRMCRKAHGAGYVTWVSVDENQFTIISGHNTLKWHASSKPAQRGFCYNCGSSLFFKSLQWPNEIHMVLASFDQEIDKQPQANVFLDMHVHWMPINHNLKNISP